MANAKDFVFMQYRRFLKFAVGPYSGVDEGIVSGFLRGSKTFDWASIASGAQATTTVTVTGAALGDFCQAAMSLSGAGLMFHADVTAANTVTVTAHNLTGGAVDLASGTLAVQCWRSEASA